MGKRYFEYVTKGENGAEERIVIPMRYAYGFVAAAIMGLFTFAGMAGSYSRVLVKAETVNHLREELANSRRDYQHLEKQTHEKDVQAASLGSLATEVSAIYGLTAGKLTLPHGLNVGKFGRSKAGQKEPVAAAAANATLKDDTTAFNEDSYTNSLDTFLALKDTASTGALVLQPAEPGLATRSALSSFANLDTGLGGNTPDMWPVLGPINSGFGQREDPILGGGEGEFHKGVDIGAPNGTPVHAPAAGRVVKAGLGSGYGREIEIDHGNGIVTVYGHLSGYNVVPGQMVTKGEVIGYVGHSGRTTGYHLHYEVQIRGTAVNPHKYLRTTMASLGGESSGG